MDPDLMADLVDSSRELLFRQHVHECSGHLKKIKSYIYFIKIMLCNQRGWSIEPNIENLGF